MSIQAFQDSDVIRRTLDRKRVAIVGLSANELRASSFVGRYLRYHGYDVVPVNPSVDRILGQKSYATIADVPGPVDVINVFRKPEAVPEIAKDAVAIEAKCLWLQFGVISEEGAAIAAAGGLDVVMDRCIKVEHARFLGRMHWLGFNTGIISAVRGQPV